MESKYFIKSRNAKGLVQYAVFKRIPGKRPEQLCSWLIAREPIEKKLKNYLDYEAQEGSSSGQEQ